MHEHEREHSNDCGGAAQSWSAGDTHTKEKRSACLDLFFPTLLVQASTSGPSGAPAHFAARRGHAALLALLEAHGGEEVKKARCPLGFSVSQWAENAGNFEFAAKLRAENWD